MGYQVNSYDSTLDIYPIGGPGTTKSVTIPNNVIITKVTLYGYNTYSASINLQITVNITVSGVTTNYTGNKINSRLTSFTAIQTFFSQKVTAPYQPTSITATSGFTSKDSDYGARVNVIGIYND